VRHRVHFVLGDAHHLPIRDDAVSAVICSEVLEHLNDPLAAILEFYRVLKSGGETIVTVPWLFIFYRLRSAIGLRILTDFQRQKKPSILLKMLWSNIDDIERLMDHTRLERRKWVEYAFGPLLSTAERYINKQTMVLPPYSLEEYIYDFFKRTLRDFGHKNFLTPSEWSNFINEAGFSKISVTGVFLVPPFADKIDLLKKFFCKIEEHLPDSLRACFSQVLFIEACK
jgi:SAM-dependent methyltransferase